MKLYPFTIDFYSKVAILFVQIDYSMKQEGLKD